MPVWLLILPQVVLNQSAPVLRLQEHGYSGFAPLATDDGAQQDFDDDDDQGDMHDGFEDEDDDMVRSCNQNTCRKSLVIWPSALFAAAIFCFVNVVVHTQAVDPLTYDASICSR